ncbi:methanogenesis marker 16 metalloprotein [Methanosarcina sp.]|uniref:methanogenesis marker 16 metalloprotein n=1 Tax=Methanosarcina sp. TaxID=2213 RepID=UPI0029887E50|nr:methanogenesis marker 16 metalloprotein [Methanosarcina sp.]MDW5550694.1 methanogenesis marker 16 metalloprotein [Methanosarcina sp.]MDW5552457.1 methanogenesis marker 16 metalloprotein [Methanosarcina sp.]MDW5560188.1 methanogenesis marker 16 metalloprotein [Methanosarcina sp.]
MKTIEEINEKIENKEAIILTAAELKSMVREGKNVTVDDVDVVTTGTFGVMSGTMAVMMVPVAEKCSFERADAIWLNGVPAQPGPCPNERLGVVDLVINGTAHANDLYGGGHLFRDLVKGKTIDVLVEAHGKHYENQVTLDDIEFARIITTRLAFKNYNALINPASPTINTIFSVTGLTGPFTETTVSGCGEINPLQNDPSHRSIGVGTRVLLNGAPGYIMGKGTRASPDKPNVSAYADMKDMDPTMMGGMKTAHGPECLTSLAVPIPVLDEDILSGLKILDQNVPLPVADVNGRTAHAKVNYGYVWGGTDKVIRVEKEKCLHHPNCAAMRTCPTEAISDDCVINRNLCINCGTCTLQCSEGVFRAKLGSIELAEGIIPISLRQSDRARAERLCTMLKNRILEQKFVPTKMLEPL